MKPPPKPRPQRRRPRVEGFAHDQPAREVASGSDDQEEHSRLAPLVWMRPQRRDDGDTVLQLEDKRAAIAQAGRYRRRHQLIYSAIALAVTLAVLWVVFFSPLFALKTVKIHQQGDQVSADSVHAVLEDYQGIPLPRLPIEDMTQAVAALTIVESVSVRRSWPHEVIVTVKGRTAIAAQKQPDDSFALIDAYGVILGSRSEQPTDIPLLSVRGDEALTTALIDDALSCLQALPGDVRARVTVADIDADGLTTLQLDNGAVVVWGSTNDTELKANVLQVLLQEDAKVYDVSSPRAPVTK
ncbi:MAG: cell division protein FtsQ/DivIB [Bowdeniella nasicola]|nr:cell division protein FtsQ/DivIB [Bowdeniella nasicola]